MKRRTAPPQSPNVKTPKAVMALGGVLVVVIIGVAYFIGFADADATVYDSHHPSLATTTTKALPPAPPPALNKSDYDARMLALAHIDIASTTLGGKPIVTHVGTTTSTTTLLAATTTATASVRVTGKKWPTPAAYPNAGALLPFHRIVAYYGNFYSRGMGVLGQYDPPEMLARLASTTASWTAADPHTPAIAAIDYIAVTAQASAGTDGKYRLRMPDSQIDKALGLADQAKGIVILDVQVGKSTVQAEVAELAKYLAMPEVHLALDPEFDMLTSQKPPGTVIGSMDASEINWAINYLSQIVKDNNLPPKILLIHRFTQGMVTNAALIKPTPEVQVVMDMDGFGSQAKKIGTYVWIVAPEPVQFTGFKLFYKNDNVPPSTMLSPAQVISLTPAPVFIQYQ